MLGNRMEMDFSLVLMHSKKKAEISLLIASEGGGWITPKSWQDDIGTSFPVAIERVQITSVAHGQEPPEAKTGLECTPVNPHITTEEVDFSLVNAEGSKEYSSFCIDSSVFNLRVTGTVAVYAADKKYQFSVKID